MFLTGRYFISISAGQRKVVLAQLKSLNSPEQSPNVMFTATFDDNNEFVFQHLIFAAEYSLGALKSD